MKMRDYEYIKSSTPVHFWVKNLDGTRTSKTRVGNITPQYVLEAHKTAFEAFSEMVKGSGSVIVVSHHAPTFFSVPEEFKHDSFGNGLYCSDLSEFILDSPQIKKWIHGHIHDTIQYPVGDDCEVLANPRGYMGLETLPNRFVLKYFDI
jgi:Icc-related predicted phosphoesterase